MVFSRIFRYFSPDVGIDLGTANTLVCVQGEGIVLDEPTVVAVKKGTQEVLLGGDAVGRTAKEMLGRTPMSIDAIRPVRAGVIADFEMTEAMLANFLRRVFQRRRWVSPRVVMAVPLGLTTVEKRALFDAAARAGASRVYLLEEPRAAGLGAGIPIHEARAHMIVDIGGGTTDVSILSLADVVISEHLPVAGDAMDEAIVKYLKHNYNILIGPNAAETLKMRLGAAYPGSDDEFDVIRGRDLLAGRPRAVTVSAGDIREAIAEPVRQIVEAVEAAIQRTGPELSGDLVETGIHLCGGGALLSGLDALLEAQTGLPVRVTADPLTTVARGTGVFLEALDSFVDVLEGERDEV